MQLLSQYFEAASQRFPQKVAIVNRGYRIKYEEYHQVVNEIAKGLIRLGVQRGDNVGIFLPNIWEYPVVFLACEKIGVSTVLINFRYQAQEFEYVLDDARPKVLFWVEQYLDKDFMNILGEIILKNPNIKKVVTLTPSERSIRLSSVSWPELIAQGKLISDAALSERSLGRSSADVVTIIYTSGTTGRPKGAMITHRVIISSLTTFQKRLGYDHNDVIGNFMPLFHAAGIFNGCTGALLGQLTMVLDHFDAGRSLSYIQEEKISFFHCVSTMVALQLNHPDFSKYDYSSLKKIYMGGGPCPPEILRQAQDKMGVKTIVGYGLTEAGSGSATTTLLDDPEELQLYSIGIPAEDLEVRIVNEERQEISRGQTGEIALRGPCVFKGYLNKPEETKAVLDENGWFYTGDMGWQGEDGYLRIVGRKKEMYIRGGENVYPAEIEFIVQKHPKVLYCAVIGIPDSIMSEEGRLYVVPKPGTGLNAIELMEYLKANLARYKVPKEIVFREHLPLTPLGKVMKKELIREAGGKWYKWG